MEADWSINSDKDLIYLFIRPKELICKVYYDDSYLCYTLKNNNSNKSVAFFNCF